MNINTTRESSRRFYELTAYEGHMSIIPLNKQASNVGSFSQRKHLNCPEKLLQTV